MKKLLLGSIILIVFAFSISLFQISCQKQATAQTTTYTLPPATSSTLGGIIVGAGLSISSNGTLSVTNSTGGLQQLNKIVFVKSIGYSSPKEIWTANYDGSNASKINIILPIGFPSRHGAINSRLSPDGQTIFFEVMEDSLSEMQSIYKCNINGSNVTRIIAGTVTGTYSATSFYLGGAY